MPNEICPICGKPAWASMNDKDILRTSCRHFGAYEIAHWFGNNKDKPSFTKEINRKPLTLVMGSVKDWAKEKFKNEARISA